MSNYCAVSQHPVPETHVRQVLISWRMCHLNFGTVQPTSWLIFVRKRLNRSRRAMYQPHTYEMDRRQPSVRLPAMSSTDLMPQIDFVQPQVHDLEVEKTFKRWLEARQVSTTTPPL